MEDSSSREKRTKRFKLPKLICNEGTMHKAPAVADFDYVLELDSTVSKVLIQPSFEYTNPENPKGDVCLLLVNNRSWKFPVQLEDKYRYINVKIIGPEKNRVAYEATIKMLSIHADSDPDTEYSSRGSTYQLSGIDLRPSKQEKYGGFKDHSEFSYFTFFREKPSGNHHGVTLRRRHAKYGDIEALGDQELLPKYLMKHYPVFTVFTIVAMLVLLVASILEEGGLASPSHNPWIGAGRDALINMGAAYFPKMDKDNEYWRLFLAVFLPVGIISSLLDILTLLFIALPMERVYGFWRIAFVYIICGVFGYGISVILLNESVDCGAGPSIMGLFAMLFLDIYENSPYLSSPRTNTFVLCLYILVNFLLSFLPGRNWISLFAALLQGFIIGVWMIPYVGARQGRRYVVVAISIPLMVYTWYLLFGGLFYLATDYGGCSFCEEATCFDSYDWCDF
eukprot:Nk52_evm31s24 gene=Nk52_evmTU31s24